MFGLVPLGALVSHYKCGSCSPEFLRKVLSSQLSTSLLAGNSVVGLDDRSHLWRTFVIISNYLTGEDGIWGNREFGWLGNSWNFPPTIQMGEAGRVWGFLHQMGKWSSRGNPVGQLRVLHSYPWRVSQRTRVLPLSRTLRCLKARARPGKFASVYSFVNYAILPVNQERPLSNSRCCTASLLLPASLSL